MTVRPEHDRAGSEVPVRVLAVVGTDVHPFARLVRQMDKWTARHSDRVECFVQYGNTDPPVHAAGEAFLDHDALEKRLVDADIFVCHGGPSTISEARRRGFRPIVVPRWRQHGEHVDDHQKLFVQRLADDELVWMASNDIELGSLLDRALADRSMVHLEAADHSSTEASVQRFADLVEGLFTR